MIYAWRKCLDKVQGDKVGARASRIGNTVSERSLQPTPQFAKSIGRVFGSAGKQADAARSAGGFTIIELLIASAVFSLVLIAAQAGFIEIGRMFYKGVSTTQTQSIASNILGSVKNDIQLAASVYLPTGAANGYTYYCFGNHRYTVNINHEVDLSAVQTLGAGGNYGLLHDSLPGDTACAAPCDPSGSCPAGSVAFNNPQELLGNKMRLVSFSVTQPNAAASPNLYNVSLIAAYGDDAVLDYADKNNPSTVRCSGSLTTQQFCSVSRLDSSVYRGVTP